MPNSLDDELKRIVQEESSKKNPELAAQHFSLGEKAFNDRDWRKARDEFQIAINWDPNERNYTGLAESYLHLNNFDQSIEASEKALQLNRDNVSARETACEAHYQMGIQFHKSGRLSEAIEAYQSAHRFGKYIISELSEWKRLADVEIGEDKIRDFAVTLENLVSIANEIEMTASDDYGSLEKAYTTAQERLDKVRYDMSHLYVLMHEMVENHSTNYLGIMVSTMINKMIYDKETIVLDLTNVRTQDSGKNYWKLNYLGFKHAFGKLVIKGGKVSRGSMPAEICYKMSGGELEMHSIFDGDFVVGREMSGGEASYLGEKLEIHGNIVVNLGPKMQGGTIHVNRKSMKPGYDYYSLIAGEEMEFGEIIIDSYVGSAKIGERMGKPRTSYRDGPKITIKGIVEGHERAVTEIGKNMEMGNIVIEGDVKYARVAPGNKFGYILIEGSVGEGYSNSPTNVAKEMEFGTVWIKGDAFNVAENMKGGHVIIEGSGYNIDCRLTHGRVDVGGPEATVRRKGYDPSKHNGDICLGTGGDPDDVKQILPSAAFYAKCFFGSKDVVKFKLK